MNIDLGQELGRVARSVHDDAAAERMNGQVRTMVGRIRRRRAARHTATGVVGVGAVAAIAVAGVQLSGRDVVPAPPATGTPTPEPAVAPLGCGWVAPEAGAATESGARLAVQLTGDGPEITQGAMLQASVTLGPEPGAQLKATDDAPEVAVLRDGVVVSPAGSLTGEFQPAIPTHVFNQALTSCDPAAAGEPLEPGEYELFATQEVTLAGSTEATAAVGRMPFTITDGEEPPTGSDEPAQPDIELTAEEERARARIEAWLAEPVANPDGVFPRCGAEAVLDDGSTPLVLDRPLDGGGVDGSGGTFETTVTMRSRDGQYVIGNAAGSGATLVLMTGDVVVGYQWLDSETLTLVDLQPEQTLEIPLRGNRMLCGTGDGGTIPGPDLPLPRGTYQAAAVVDVMLKEIGTPGGDAESVTRTVPVMSEVFDLTIG